MRSALGLMAVLFAIGLCWAAPTAASAKSKGKSCAAAEAAFQATGAGDSDGDGLSDCREKRQLGTSMSKVDSDGDSVSDGDEVNEHSDPLDVDSDDDGVEDGEDDTPGIPEQEINGFLDALTCPQLPGGIGEITVLGAKVPLNDLTVFEDTTCAALAEALLVPGAPPIFVEIDVLEDSLGALTAAEVEVEQDEHNDNEDHDADGAQEGAN